VIAIRYFVAIGSVVEVGEGAVVEIEGSFALRGRMISRLFRVELSSHSSIRSELFRRDVEFFGWLPGRGLRWEEW